MIELKKTTQEDLLSLFEFQTDKEGIYMAAFTPEDPFNKEAYMLKWSKIIQNPEIRMDSIYVGGKLVGSVVHFDMFDETNISYWIDRKQWGRGYASEGLKQFLLRTDKRPLYARVATDNIGSQKVLEKNGFRTIGKDQGYANGRSAEIEEFIYFLEE